MISERMQIALSLLNQTREEVFIALSNFEKAKDFYARVVREETQEKEGEND